jgi:hypothetical protein
MADDKKQVQLCLKWPNRGFKIDSMRLASIDMVSWEAMLNYVSVKHDLLLTFKTNIGNIFPFMVERGMLSQLLQECDCMIDYERLNDPEMDALLTLSMFLSQALDQREAIISIEYWDNAYFETQTFIEPGVDLLADMIEINKGENPSSGT